MSKTAFIFPGQGSQSAGMGKDLYDSFASARRVFQEADRILGFSLSGLCFQGPEERLRQTENTQPAVLTVSIAILRVLEERGYRPDFVAGHSLGEYSALVCAGSLPLAEAVALVRKRGRYMQEAVPEDKGAMAAVLGLDAERVLESCRGPGISGVVAPANYNAPDQTVIAGEVGAVRRASERAKELGAKRVIALPVSAPFHCDLMSPARDRLAVDLRSLDFRDLAIPLISNVDAAPLREGAAAREALVRQVCSPVRWVETVRFLVDAGVGTFVEVGPGRVLAGLVKKIDPRVQTLSVEGIRGIEALASEISSAKM